MARNRSRVQERNRHQVDTAGLTLTSCVSFRLCCHGKLSRISLPPEPLSSTVCEVVLKEMLSYLNNVPQSELLPYTIQLVVCVYSREHLAEQRSVCVT